MTRRTFPAALAAGALAGQTSAERPSIFEIRTIHLRNTLDNQRQRLLDFLERTTLPAFARAGIGPAGCFAGSIAEEMPFVLAITSYASMAAMEERRAALNADAEYRKALDAFNAQPGLNFDRIDSSLLRGFSAFPHIDVPPTPERGTPARLFELRRYESNNSSTLARKIHMFESGEIAIFKRLGMRPVFFGEMVVGARMPNLVYMLMFDDMATREKAWRAFGSDPEWQKMRAMPGFSDAEIVSTISVSFLQPLGFSPIR